MRYVHLMVQRLCAQQFQVSASLSTDNVNPWPAMILSCPLCKQAGRSNYQHFLRKRSFLPEHERKYMAKIHLIVEMLDINNSIPTFEMEAVSDNNPDDTITFSLSMFLTRHSPYFDIFWPSCGSNHYCIDGGATGNMIHHSVVRLIGMPTGPTAQFPFTL